MKTEVLDLRRNSPDIKFETEPADFQTAAAVTPRSQKKQKASKQKGKGVSKATPRKSKKRKAKTKKARAAEADPGYLYEVEKLLKIRKLKNGKRRIHVKWRDFDDESWIPEAYLHLPLSAYPMEEACAEALKAQDLESGANL